jgi:hypothetical protein
MGYRTNCSVINATQVGGVIDKPWLIVVRYNEEFQKTTWQWQPVTEEIRRPMNNCLRPTGIPYSTYRTDLQTAKARLAHTLPIPDCEKDPMPAHPGHLISTLRGTRRLLNDKLARRQGVPKSWMANKYPRSKLVNRTVVPVHILEYAGAMLTKPVKPVEPDEDSDEEPPSLIPRCFASEHELVEPFHWNPPNIAAGSEWTKARVTNLLAAAQRYSDPAKLIEDGMLMLRKHQDNYDAEGPTHTHMQLLW